MKINYRDFNHHQRQVDQLKKDLAVNESVKVQLSTDSVVAWNELTRSLALLHPHKRSIAVLGGQPDPFRQLAAGFSAEGYNVQELPVDFLKDGEEKFKTHWAQLRKDTLFVMGAFVEPFTGGFYPWDFVRKEAPARQIFSLIHFDSNALFFGPPQIESPFEALVIDPLWGQENSLALTLRGERCHGEPFIWGDSYFHDENVAALTTTLRSPLDPKTQNENQVRRFESGLSSKLGGKVKLLWPKQPRVFDRSVVFIEGLNGDALVKTLAQKGFDTSTAASCFWNQPFSNKWLPSLGFTPENIESSLIVPLATLHRAEFFDALLAIILELKKLS